MKLLKDANSFSPVGAPIENMDHWGKTRRRGKAIFIFERALLFSLPMSVGVPLFTYFFNGKFDIDELYFKSLFFLAVGFIQGLMAWRSSEEKYQQYLDSCTLKNLSAP